MNKQTIDAGKSTAIISYILIVGVLIAMSMNAEPKNPFAAFHIRQSLGLSILFVSLGLIISNFDNIMISSSMWIFVSILWTYGVFTAIKGEMRPIPLLGSFFQKWLKS
jgi:uncharacterized membrane protein